MVITYIDKDIVFRKGHKLTNISLCPSVCDNKKKEYFTSLTLFCEFLSYTSLITQLGRKCKSALWRTILFSQGHHKEPCWLTGM